MTQVILKGGHFENDWIRRSWSRLTSLDPQGLSLVDLPKSPHDLDLNWSSGLASSRGGFQLRPGKLKSLPEHCPRLTLALKGGVVGAG